jgi:hypothetical protein
LKEGEVTDTGNKCLCPPLFYLKLFIHVTFVEPALMEEINLRLAMKN